MWKPLETVADLPPLGSRESQNYDFKAKPYSDDFEIAKDVAAFANASGGSILIGAAGGDHLAKWLPISANECAAALGFCELAIRDRCRPGPAFTLSDIALQDGRLLAVNVWPFPGQLVGVRLKVGEARCGPTGKEPSDVYFYPQRVGTHTKAVLPEQIPMFVDARIRRIGILLEQAVGGKAVLIATKYQRENAKWVQPVQVESLDLFSNTLRVFTPVDGQLALVPIPLDAVETVSKGGDGWHIYIAGILTSIHNPSGELASLQTYFDPLG